MPTAVPRVAAVSTGSARNAVPRVVPCQYEAVPTAVPRVAPVSTCSARSTVPRVVPVSTGSAAAQCHV